MGTIVKLKNSDRISKHMIAQGVVHKVSKDIEKAVTVSSALIEEWEKRTPLARNEWLCWIESAKKIETRSARIKRMVNDLQAGKRRPCCWAGCPHR